jgi:hypothetical protein
LFRKEIIEFENEYPGRYPIKTIFQMLEDLISNGETSFEKNVAILVDKFGPQILLQERFGENMIKHTINFIVEEDDPYKLSEDQIREILDLIFFENEYLIQETDAIEYAREEEKNKTADILEEILRGAAIKIEEQLDRKRELIDTSSDGAEDRWSLLAPYRKSRLGFRLSKLYREGKEEEYGRVLEEIREDEGEFDEIADEIDAEIRNMQKYQIEKKYEKTKNN